MSVLRSRNDGNKITFFNRVTGADIFTIDTATDSITLLKVSGVDQAAALAAPLAGVAAGYKLARGETALDGSNPTTVVTGLATIVSFVAILKGSAAPGDNTSVLTWNPNATPGSADVYGWKNTAGNDPTLVASTGTETFDWIAIGT